MDQIARLANTEKTKVDEIICLTPWKYPFALKMMIVFSLSFIFFVYYTELPQHFKLAKKVINADYAFYAGDFDTAVELYTNVVKMYPHCKNARIRMVASHFQIATKKPGLQGLQAYQKGIDLYGSIIFEKDNDWYYFISSIPQKLAQEIRKDK